VSLHALLLGSPNRLLFVLYQRTTRRSTVRQCQVQVFNTGMIPTYWRVVCKAVRVPWRQVDSVMLHQHDCGGDRHTQHHPDKLVCHSNSDRPVRTTDKVQAMVRTEGHEAQQLHKPGITIAHKRRLTCRPDRLYTSTHTLYTLCTEQRCVPLTTMHAGAMLHSLLLLQHYHPGLE
jgi:hypothetical protein